MFRALTTDRDLLPRLLRVDGLVEEARSRVERYLATRAGHPALTRQFPAPYTSISVRSVKEQPENAPSGQLVAKSGVWLPRIVNRTN